MVLKFHISTECRKSMHTNEPPPLMHPHNQTYHFLKPLPSSPRLPPCTNATNITDPKENRTYKPDSILAFQCYIPAMLSNSVNYTHTIQSYAIPLPPPPPLHVSLSPHPPPPLRLLGKEPIFGGGKGVWEYCGRGGSYEDVKLRGKMDPGRFMG
jgi:hypothetical protein